MLTASCRKTLWTRTANATRTGDRGSDPSAQEKRQRAAAIRFPARMCPLPQSTRPGFMKRTRPAKPRSAARSAGRRSSGSLRPQNNPIGIAPERHRIGEHNRPSGWRYRQADDAADQEPSYLQLSDPEQRQPLAARRQKRLPRQSKAGAIRIRLPSTEQHEDQRQRLGPERASSTAIAGHVRTTTPNRQSPPGGMGLSPPRGTPLSCQVRRVLVDPISSRSLCLVGRQVSSNHEVTGAILSAAQTSSGQPTGE